MITDTEQFTAFHDLYLREWENAMATGEVDNLDKMSENYYVTFFSKGKDRPTFFERQEAMEGMRQSVHSLVGATKRFENRLIRMKDEDKAIVFYEQVIEKGHTILSRLFTIENWEKIDGQWTLMREIEEQI